jgi:site-specific recombinase XerD
MASKWKPIVNWKQEDITKYISYMIDKGYKPSYIEMTKSLLRRYFVFAGKEKFVKDLKVKFPKINLKASDILTPDDINKLIESATLLRDKALIAALFESGARISELIAIKVKDLQETPQGLKVLIPGTKTGEEYRPCLLINSAQYIRNHVIYPPLKPDDKVFDFTSVTAQRILRMANKVAGINKPVSPHKLRHAQATYMTRKGYQESIIRAKLGWTGDSQMVARYTHLDGNDIINATLERENGGEHKISPELTKQIIPGAPIAIADPSMEFARINNENAELKAQMDAQQTKMDATQKDMESMKRAVDFFNSLTPEDKAQMTILRLGKNPDRKPKE